MSLTLNYVLFTKYYLVLNASAELSDAITDMPQSKF